MEEKTRDGRISERISAILKIWNEPHCRLHNEGRLVCYLSTGACVELSKPLHHIAVTLSAGGDGNGAMNGGNYQIVGQFGMSFAPHRRERGRSEMNMTGRGYYQISRDARQGLTCPRSLQAPTDQKKLFIRKSHPIFSCRKHGRLYNCPTWYPTGRYHKIHLAESFSFVCLLHDGDLWGQPRHI